MAHRIAASTLNASTIDILNVIRDNASLAYQNQVPEVATAVDIPRVGEVLYGTPAMANEFINALVNRIAAVRVQSATFNNPYARLKKGMIDYGETIEDIFVGITKAFTFSQEKAEAREFKQYKPNVKSAFHAMNWQVIYPVSVSMEQLKQAFLNAGVKIVFSDLRNEAESVSETLHYEGGIRQFVEHIHNTRGLEPLAEEVIYVSGTQGDSTAEIALMYNDSYNELILFSMAGITPGSVLHFSKCGYDFPEDGLYVSEEFYHKNPEQCRLFAEASRKGWDWVRNNREEALDIVMKYVKEANVPTNRYNQKWMLDAILEAQEDARGGKPSYTLDEDAFNRVNEALVKYGYIAKPIVYERFTGGNR